MKDITISKKRIERELWFLLASFIAAYGMNVFAIVHWDRPVSECWTTIGYVLALAVCIYAVSVFARLILFGLARLARFFVNHKN